MTRLEVREWVREQLALAPAPSQPALDHAWALLSAQTSRPIKTDGTRTQPRSVTGEVAPSLANDLRESGLAFEQEAS